MYFQLRLCGLVAALLISIVQAIPTITTKGSKFFTSDGDQFFIKGVAYQLSEADPLVDGSQCRMDANLMKTLGANTIRVYHVGPGDHTECMSAFSDAGIYLFIDLDTFNTMILQDDAYWNQTQEHAFETVMDEFHQFDNTAGLFIGNEVIQDGNHSEAAVYVKAATRDLKNYRNSKGYRQIPVGYSHADISSLRPNLQNYLTCGTDSIDSVDFFGLNAYEWCGTNSYKGSGYSGLTAQVMDYPVPIFFSETGCNKPEPRTFQDQVAIFGPQMDPYWSGAIIYEWIEEANNFGLITYGDDTNALQSPAATIQVIRSGSPTPMTPDFSVLKSVWAQVSPSSVASSAYSPSLTAPPCPGFTPNIWEVNGDVSLPSVGATLDSSAQSSINAGTAAAPSATGSATPSSGKKGAASGGKEIAGVCIGLGAVMLGFVVYL
ncbi:MAG: hypothetical protein M1828_001804 [Chrysothrix sp. TS-e1954]|nr:MAG: hypothetical protein M1828_001804 [Chrysothrix sp. TS-e1954]